MPFLPIVERELRAEARNRLNGRLRVLGTLPGVLVLGFVLTQVPAGATTQGRILFTALHVAMLVMIGLLGPFLTADCLSREKREGTLGLLFLTPLRPGAIVVGKSVVHLLRAFTVWLASLPVLMVPFVLGGLTWSGVGRAVGLQLAVGLAALGAGLVASAWTKNLTRAHLLAVLLAGGFIGLVLAVLVSAAWVQAPATLVAGLPPGFFLLRCVDVGQAAVGLPLGLATLPWLEGILGALTFSVLLFLGSLWLAGHRLKRTWRDEPPSAREARLRAALSTPRFGLARFRRRMARRLERQPVFWLQTRSATDRLAAWLLGGVVLAHGYAVTVTNDPAAWYQATRLVVIWGLTLLLAFEAANSFRVARETRMLELLLVTPLSADAILAGRLRALWGRYLPALALYFAVAAVFNTFWLWRPPWWEPPEQGWWWWPLPVWAALPLVGLYFGFRQSHPLLAYVATVFFGALWPLSMPGMVAYAFKLIRDRTEVPLEDYVPGWLIAEPSPFWFLVTLAGLAALCGRLVWRDLGQRRVSGSIS